MTATAHPGRSGLAEFRSLNLDRRFKPSRPAKNSGRSRRQDGQALADSETPLWEQRPPRLQLRLSDGLPQIFMCTDTTRSVEGVGSA